VNINLGNDNYGMVRDFDPVLGRPIQWPFPYPFPFPFPFPNGPTGGSPYDMAQNPTGSDADREEVAGLFQEGISIALKSKLGKEFDKKEMSRHLKEEVLPKIDSAETVEDVNGAMERVYKVFPDVKEFVYEVTEKYGTGETGTVAAKKKMPKWLKALLKLVVAVIEFILAVAG
jgi:hypothetical protein